MLNAKPTLLRSVLAALLLAACQGAGTEAADSTDPGAKPASAPEDLQARARRLAQEILIVDTHVDVPYRLVDGMEDISQRTEKGDFDYPRAREGGLDAPFMSIYVPARYQTSGGAKGVADELIDMVEKFAADWPDKFAVVASTAEVEAQFGQGKVLLPMGMENGAPVEGDLANLRHFYDRGIRYVTLTHSENNQICDSSYATERKWNGLSPFGREVVAEMNRLGIMIDVSHVSDDAFHQVIELTKAPVIASHSSCRAFTPGWERNMADDMIVRLAENGGVIQINFGSAFLTKEAHEASDALWKARGEYQKAHDVPDGDPRLDEFTEEHRKEHPPVYADVADVVAHVDHVVELVGIDHVGLGSDFDGVGDSLPTGLKDVSYYPNLIAELLEAGYSEDDVRKICGGNLMRVWRRVEEIARELQTSSPEA